MSAAIPAKVQKLVYQEASSCCAFCDEADIHCLEIHHIIPRAEGGTDNAENLILVCGSCHSLITYGQIAKEEIMETKRAIQERARRHAHSNPASSVVNVTETVNTGIIANTVNIKTPRKSRPKMQPPVGSIASDLIKRNYIKYLIDRYNEFKSADINVVNFKYSIIYGAVQREFKCKWDFVPLHRFEELAAYLQGRVDKTILGKVRKSRGQRNYEAWVEYLEKQRRGSEG